MPPTHELVLRVRYSETDQMGVVHHAAYLVWFEEGRTALMRAMGVPYDEMERAGFAMGVRRLDVRYRAATRYGDQVRVITTLARVRGASLGFDYELRRLDDDELLATASVDTASLALGSLRPAPIPAQVRAAIEAAS